MPIRTTTYGNNLPGLHEIEYRNGLYKHKKMTDIAAFPEVVLWDNINKNYFVELNWFNITCKKRVDMGLYEWFAIQPAKINDWEFYDEMPLNTMAMR